MNKLQLPRMTNQEYEYVESQASQRNMWLRQCPTCRSQQVELSPGYFDWPENSVYRYLNEEFICNCEQQDALRRHYLLADVPMTYWTLGVDDYFGDPEALVKVQEYLTNWPQYKAYGLGMKIYSQTLGVGKTMLAALIAKTLIQRRERVVFSSMYDAITANQLPADEAHSRMQRLRTRSVLILDEVGRGISTAQTAWMASQIEYLLRHRISHNLVTIVTTNLTEDELESEYPRCFSLLAEKQIEVHVQGVDARSNGDKRFLDLELARNGEARPLI